MHDRRRFSLAALALGLAPRQSLAQSSSPPIRILVGLAPGGAVDLTARILAESMRAQLGRNIVVENKPGAAGRLAVMAIKQSPADGDTLMLMPHGTMTLFPLIYKQLGYDPAKDFTPVGRVAEVDYAFSTGSATPAKTVADYLAWARDPGNKAAFGSPGNGTVLHFLGQGFAGKAGVEITHVGYKGTAPAMVDLVGGTVSLAVTSLSDALEHHRAGKVRILAVASRKRSPFAPEVPTLKEAGVDLVLEGWYGLYAPVGTPPARIQALYKALEASAARIEPQLARHAIKAAALDPDKLLQLQRAEASQWEQWVKASGFKPQD